MRIGYACLTVGVQGADMRSCVMKNASEERLLEIIASNLQSLDHILDYNIENGIKLFRISSDLIPFGSSPINTLKWWEHFEPQFLKLGEKIRNNSIRVSLHPGQYTVINSPDEAVVLRAIKDLDYHTKVLDSLGMGPENKIILHVGGVYQDKESAIARFINTYHKLEDSVKQRLVIENDDKSYTVEDVLDISKKLGVPVVFDNLHNYANPSPHDVTEEDWIDECCKTWQEQDGPQKIHYSQQDYGKKAGSHSASIRIKEFMEFYHKLNRYDLDIMLEVKDKNLSAVKCSNCISTDKKMIILEQEWSRYKYSVLEKSHNNYSTIRNLLKDKEKYPVVSFYRLVEDALGQNESIGNSINAAMHVWGYLKDIAAESEKKKFLKMIDDYQQGKVVLPVIKNYLRRLSDKYHREYLLSSYYFIL